MPQSRAFGSSPPGTLCENIGIITPDVIMSSLALPDPRQYPSYRPGTLLIDHARSLLGAADDAARADWRDALRAAMNEALERDDLLRLSVALAMAPAREVYRTLWGALRNSVEEVEGRHACVFAIPLVLVVGAREAVELPGQVDDVDTLNAILRDGGVFAPGAEVWLSGKLLAPDSVVEITPAQLYRYTRQLADAARGLPLELKAAPVVAREEGVFLRYLVGVAMQNPDAGPAVRLDGDVGAWGLPLMKFLGEQLGRPGATLFPIARAPQALMQAMVTGQRTRLDVALQVFASSAIRRLRDAGQEPVAVVSSHENNEIHFTVSAREGQPEPGGFVWPLGPQDSVGAIESDFRTLMGQCQVSDVRVAVAVQPAERAGAPVFLYPADVMPASALNA
jgi:hypothetical protein